MNPKTSALVTTASLALAGALCAVPVPATITLNNDNDFPGYVTKADDANLYVSQFEDGSAARATSLASIKGISWRQPNEWRSAMELWDRRDLIAATAAFAKAAEDYKGLSASRHPLLKDNIGALAVYYQMECLRRTGKFSEMMEPFVRIQKLNLGSKWQDQIRLFQGWAHLAGGKWEPLNLMMQVYEVKKEAIPGVGVYTVAPNEPPLQNSLNVHHMAQVAYLRAISTDHLADDLAADLASLDPRAEATRADREALIVQIAQMRSQALTDYSRAFTINYGAERGLALRSMLGAIRLLKKSANYEDSYAMQKEAHGIAVLFDGLTGGKLPLTLKGLVTPPVDPNAGEGAE